MDLVEMSKGELERYTVMRKLEACLINQQQAAMALNLSVMHHQCRNAQAMDDGPRPLEGQSQTCPAASQQRSQATPG